MAQPLLPYDPSSSPVFERVEKILLGNMAVPKPHRTQEMAAIFEALLDKLVDTDQGTGLPTAARAANELRTVIDERKHIRKIGGTPEPYTVVFLDLNGFKHYNDSLGHIKTNGLIRAFAEELEQATRQSAGSLDAPAADTPGWAAELRHKSQFKADMVARYHKGGDEFLILMPGISQDQAERRMTDIAKRIAAKTFVLPEDRITISNLTFSYGCYELDTQLRDTEGHEWPFSAFDKANHIMRQRKTQARKTPGYTPVIASVLKEYPLPGADDNTVIVAPKEPTRAPDLSHGGGI